MALNLIPFVIAAGAGAYLAARLAKKKKKIPTEEKVEPAIGIVKKGTVGKWAWRVREQNGAFIAEVKAPGATEWIPAHSGTRANETEAMDNAVGMAEAAIKIKEEEDSPGGVLVVNSGAISGYGWRVRMVGENLYIGDVLVSGSNLWTPAHSDARADPEAAKLLAQELILIATGA